MIQEIGSLLVETVFGMMVFVLLLRFYMQLVRAPFRNPIGEFTTALSNWIVLPVRRFVPGLFGIDLSTLLLAWVAQVLMIVLMGMLRGASLSSAAIGLVLVMAALGIARYFLYVLMGVVIIHVVTSWVGQGSPMGPVVDALAKPLYRPFRKFIPPMGNIDLTPLVVVVLIQIGLIVVAGASRALVMPVLPQ